MSIKALILNLKERSNKLSLFGISDLHLCLSSGKDKAMDIFNGWENYIEKLKCNWTNLVSDEDTVVIAGDISWAKKLDESFADFSFLNFLPGKKIILKGNHDYWWSSKNKMNTYFLNNSFNTLSILHNSAFKVGDFAICGTRGWFIDSSEKEDGKILKREVGRLNTSIDEALKFNAEPIVFLHYPPVYGGVECSEIMNVLIERNIKKCFYGHIHGKNARKKIVIGDYKGINFNLLSCDFVNFCPVLIG